MSVFDYLEPYSFKCQRCGGSVLSDLICMNCGAEHDQDGNWLEPVLASPVRLIGNKGAGFHKRKYNTEGALIRHSST